MYTVLLSIRKLDVRAGLFDAKFGQICLRHNMSHSGPSVLKCSNKRELNPAQPRDMKVATNNVTGIDKNICDFATRPLFSAVEMSENSPSFPENIIKDQVGFLFHWNMPSYMTPLFPNQRNSQSADSAASKMNHILSFQDHIEKLKALRDR